MCTDTSSFAHMYTYTGSSSAEAGVGVGRGGVLSGWMIVMYRLELDVDLQRENMEEGKAKKEAVAVVPSAPPAAAGDHATGEVHNPPEWWTKLVLLCKWLFVGFAFACDAAFL